MTKPMKYRELAKKLEAAGFTSRQGKGDHEVWRNGSVTVTITQARVVSPAVVRDALKAIERSQA
ncbi:type II toxin-antitoxin system HicA family toxin [Actinomycetaceae bacterium WB03_NA08]|uniref:Type II toxin-antitoxin system HicA family toxin n=1 Tax=Scrofimicrobium canadense TaxID=2652290 RepID=A0A6N7W7W6_9ACTO|nr:type II toxin-antitoxin system HicA family toxin [Scrofimicrobium canadense]MSS84228.1 type II toxin-antitoxin system HicA family toxin [Scrofimicrobium canadense]